MNGVETESIHIVRQSRATTDTRNHSGFVGRDTEGSHSLLEGVENGMVATTGTPTNCLVAFEIGGGECCLFHSLVFLHKFSYAFYDFRNRERLTLNLVNSENMSVGITAL